MQRQPSEDEGRSVPGRGDRSGKLWLVQRAEEKPRMTGVWSVVGERWERRQERWQGLSEHDKEFAFFFS